MKWSLLAESIWQMRPWTAWVVFALYFVPLFRLAGFPVQFGARFFMRINKPFGLWEHLVYPFRDSIVSLWLAGGAVWFFWLGIERGEWSFFLISSSAVFLLFAGYGMRRFRRSAHARLLDFVRRFPSIHPQEFFDHLICSAGAVRHELPQRPFVTIDPSSLDFRGARAGRAIGLPRLLAGVWSTIRMARLVLLARDEGGPEFLRASASALAVVWGTRMCQLARAAVTVEGKERLPRPGGAEIYLFTHMSFLDFAFVSLALASRPIEGDIAAENHLPSFLIAKDHFRDNIIFYRILGIGRAAEAMGMTFVERREMGSADRAMAVESRALDNLLKERSVLAIFPQGTRAVGYKGPKGERLDGAYYTVGSRKRIKLDGGHLKKGAAYIAAAAAERTFSAGDGVSVKVVPVAISGTAIACPRGSMRVLAGVHVRLRAGEPIIVDGQSAASVEHLHARIDAALKTAGKVHAELERRFFEDMRGLIDPREIEEVAIAMKPWRGDDYLVHAILDAIYACPPKHWRPFIGELVHSLLNFSTRDELLAMKGRVADSVRL